jgi:hypothetical protein
MLKITTFGENADSLVVNARLILKKVAFKTYEGWDEGFDMAFDNRSIWIMDSDNHRRIHGFCKVIFAKKISAFHQNTTKSRFVLTRITCIVPR